MIRIRQDGRQYYLENDRITYALSVIGGVPAHLYFGRRVGAIHEDALLSHLGLGPAADFSLQECSLDKLQCEYPSGGLGDFRPGALTVEAPDGTRTCDLRVTDAAVTKGKPALPGLPASFGGECETLTLTLADTKTGLQAQLLYTVFDDCDIIARSASLTNAGSDPLRVTRAMSACLDLPDDGWDLLTFSGAWSREREEVVRPLSFGLQSVFSSRGASSLQTSPFLCVRRPGTDEDRGEAAAMALVYSGSFRAEAFSDQYHTGRLLIGLGDENFSWKLEPGESLQLPEALLAWSGAGMNGLSRAYHTLIRRHLVRSKFAHTERPILLNSWEAAYFDFDEDKLVRIAKDAADCGCELFVMDDGWFGRRDNDFTSLGDWFVDRRKLPGGLGSLSEKVHALGLKFGLWMEPEMISRESELYRAHPDWAIQTAGREPVEARHQLVLDLSRQDVQDFVFGAVSSTLRDAKADYLKWDMNRFMTNIGSTCLPADRQQELPHRYMLGLYSVLERIVGAFPDVLFESCSSGGGRFDAGMFYYMPQCWCSDDTDAVTRCRIQYSTSLVFPPETMGSHVSAVPNHQTGRVTPLETRFAVAMGGCFGYELDPGRLTDEERAAMRSQTDYIKAHRQTLLHGDFHRLLSPYHGNETAWITVSPDRRDAVFTLVRYCSITCMGPMRVRLTGLDPAARYRIEETGEIYGGDELMYAGLTCPLSQQDAASLIYTLTAV